MSRHLDHAAYDADPTRCLRTYPAEHQTPGRYCIGCGQPNATHDTYVPIGAEEPGRFEPGPCPDCGRRMGWNGHRYGPCGVRPAPRVRESGDLALSLIVGTLESGGATVQPIVEGPEVPTTGYGVGGAVPGVTFAWGERIDRYTLEREVSRLAREAAARGAYLGAWLSEGTHGTWCIDVTEYLGDLEDALALARARGEAAIWDVTNGADVRADAEVLA